MGDRMSIESRVVVISGATGRLGRIVAARMAQQGARLALFGRNADVMEQLAHELNLPGDRLLTGIQDLSKPKAAQAAAAAVIDKFGKAEIVLHLVGKWIGGKSIVEMPPADVEAMLQQHLWTTYHVIQAFVPHLVKNQWGRVIVVSSPSAQITPALGAAYSIGKAAEETLILSLAAEMRETGVTANILQVRTIDPRPNWGTTPDEVAATMLFLCSDAGRAINGARIPLLGER